MDHASEKKRKILFDRTNLGSEAGAILQKAILEPAKHIDLPQNPFSINRSYEEDLLPSRKSEHSIDNFNSNQQQRFITLIDIIYEKRIPLMITSESNLHSVTSSKSLIETFKRTTSRLHELTSIVYN